MKAWDPPPTSCQNNFFYYFFFLLFRFSDINDLLDICSPLPEEWNSSKWQRKKKNRKEGGSVNVWVGGGGGGWGKESQKESQQIVQKSLSSFWSRYSSMTFSLSTLNGSLGSRILKRSSPIPFFYNKWSKYPLDAFHWYFEREKKNIRSSFFEKANHSHF